MLYVLKRQSEVAYESISPLYWAELENDADAKVVRVIHAMDMTDDMKRQLRRRRR